MNKNIDPFLYNLPHLDLHGYDRTGAVAMTKMFIDECLKIKEKKIVIIHGRGEGILKKSIHEDLKTNHNVIEYKTNNYNDGETIIILK